ncbi:hypothetical protein PQ43W_20 [Ralstonia phage PQ43W]
MSDQLFVLLTILPVLLTGAFVVHLHRKRPIHQLRVCHLRAGDNIRILHGAQAGREVYFVRVVEHGPGASQLTLTLRARGAPTDWETVRDTREIVEYVV